jgi:hypothetical protein
MLSKEVLKEATGDLDPLKGGSIKGKAAAAATALAHTARSPRVAGSLIGLAAPRCGEDAHAYK